MAPDTTELIPISLVAHHAFCPRRAWLEAVGETVDVAQLAVGQRDSEPSDDPRGSRSGRLRAVEIVAPRLGIVGRCDTVEVAEDDSLTVVEHKATPLRREPSVTFPNRVQLALLGLGLEEMGHRVAGYEIWFSTHRRRVPVQLTPDDVDNAREHLRAVQAVIASSAAPPALVDDPRCRSCSHLEVCLPDERALEPVPRRVMALDPVGESLHLVTPGARASLRAGRILVAHRGEQLASVPLERVTALFVHGNVDVSTAVVRELLWRGVPVLWLSGTGRLVGWANSAHSPNGGPRHRQHLAVAEGRVELAAEIVSAKIANQATLIRRLGDVRDVVVRLRELQRHALAAASVEELLGIEGDAASRYFGAFDSMLSCRVRSAGFALGNRSRRPAANATNAALNYVYALLLADVVKALVSCGLDPYAGFLHAPTRNKPALALDLMEEFRAPLADAVLIGALNNGELQPNHLSEALGSPRLRESGRRALTAAYERRLGTAIRHPLFGYRATWRRIIEIQARLLLGYLDGTQPRYAGMRVR